jgi:SAM-dependent methyltransferase
MWEERHRGATPGEPEPSLLEMLPLMPHGIALDVAAGTGRNSFPLARTGIKVVTADFSETGMRAISELARRERLPIAPVVADLEETFPFRPESFDVILNVTFLDRALVPRLKSALRGGGVLLFDTFPSIRPQAAVHVTRASCSSTTNYANCSATWSFCAIAKGS